MDSNIGFWALLTSAIGIGVAHSAMPDHWAPFAAVARDQKWSYGKTAAVSAFAGFGHVTGSAVLGIIGLFIGREMVHSFGSRFEGLAPNLLIGFGLLYALYGWRMRSRHHHDVAGYSFEHSHPHARGQEHPHRDVTPLALFVMFSLDPCVLVIPVIFAAAAMGWAQVLTLVAAYEIATILAVVSFSCLAYAGWKRVRAPVLETHGTVAAGLVVAAVGVAVQALGI